MLIKTVELLKTRGVTVGGMVSREVRSCGDRVGFEILDLASGKNGWLAHINQKSGPQVGKYHVCLNDLNNIGAAAIVGALENADVVAIDEIGPMELFSEHFRRAVKQALESSKPVLAVVHAKAKDPLIAEAKQRADAEVFTVTLANRDQLPQMLMKRSEK